MVDQSRIDYHVSKFIDLIDRAYRSNNFYEKCNCTALAATHQRTMDKIEDAIEWPSESADIKVKHCERMCEHGWNRLDAKTAWPEEEKPQLPASKRPVDQLTPTERKHVENMTAHIEAAKHHNAEINRIKPACSSLDECKRSDNWELIKQHIVAFKSHVAAADVQRSAVDTVGTCAAAKSRGKKYDPHGEEHVWMAQQYETIADCANECSAIAHEESDKCQQK